MRIPYPTRISVLHSAVFATVLCAVQMVEGTAVYFSAATFFFIVIATLAFNAAGGLSRPSGGYVFFYATFTVIIGLIVKAFLGEAAETNLFAPQTTMLVYVGGISAMYVAALAAHHVTPKKALLEGITDPENWGSASIGCIIIGLTVTLFTFLSASAEDDQGASRTGSLIGFISQIDRFLPLGILLGTMHTIRSSGGRRFLNLPVAVTVVFMVVYGGLLGSSKEGFFTPLFCVILAAAASRYNFSLAQIATFALGAIVSVVFVVPYIQSTKAMTGSILDKAEFAVEYFTNTGKGGEERSEDRVMSYEEYNDFALHYYNEPHGFADRLEMIAVDDALIDVTDRTQTFGLYPVAFAFINLVPHFIWPGKPIYAFGNMFSHEIGHTHYQQSGEYDTTTGISFSPTSDAYHEAKWVGVLLIAPALWFGAFFMLDWLCGDARKGPWGLMGVVLTAHIAPEGMLSGVVGLIFFGFASIYLVSFLAAYVLPFVARLTFGVKQVRFERRMPLRGMRPPRSTPAPPLPNRPV